MQRGVSEERINEQLRPSGGGRRDGSYIRRVRQRHHSHGSQCLERPVAVGDSAHHGWRRPRHDYRAERGVTSFLASWHRAQIALGELAERQADRPLIKFFALQMIQESTTALEELDELSGTPLSRNSAIDATHQGYVTQLWRLSGSEFDRACMSIMVQSLDAARLGVQSRTGSASSEGVRAHLSDTTVTAAVPVTAPNRSWRQHCTRRRHEFSRPGGGNGDVGALA